MTLNEYQDAAASTAIYPQDGKTIYPLLGLVGETGEVVEKFYSNIDVGNNYTFNDIFIDITEVGKAAERLKKTIRDKAKDNPYIMERLAEAKAEFDAKCYNKEFVDKVKKELGGVMWYIAALARDIGLSLEEICDYNVKQLKSRQERNVLQGSGDDR